MSDPKDCVDRQTSSVTKFQRFVKELESISPNYGEWVQQQASADFSNNGKPSQETRLLYIVSAHVGAIDPDRYMNMGEVDRKYGMLNADYYTMLAFYVHQERELLDELGKL